MCYALFGGVIARCKLFLQAFETPFWIGIAAACCYRASITLLTDMVSVLGLRSGHIYSHTSWQKVSRCLSTVVGH